MESKTNDNSETKQEISVLSMKFIALVAVISIFVSSLSIFAYDKYYAKKIATFDLVQYLKDKKNQYVNGEIDDEQLQYKINNELQKIIDNIPDNYVVITRDVVLKNAEIINQ